MSELVFDCHRCDDLVKGWHTDHDLGCWNSFVTERRAFPLGYAWHPDTDRHLIPDLLRELTEHGQ